MEDARLPAGALELGFGILVFGRRHWRLVAVSPLEISAYNY